MSWELPEQIDTEEELDELLTRPRPVLVELVKSLKGPLLILGAGGKMGPTLAGLLSRAAEAAGRRLEILAASRFSDDRARKWLEARGVRTIPCDLLERGDVEQLPEAENLLYLVGLKFGTEKEPSTTWAVNTLPPAHVCERFPRARIAALSTGNVYPLVAVSGGGSVESDALTPLGEYANAAVARERIFEHLSMKRRTPIVLIRLNYAVDLRYGVILDIARKVFLGEPVDLAMGYLNFIWQGDANERIIRSLALTSSPPTPINLTGPAMLSVRQLALEFAKLFDRQVSFTGAEASTALLSNSSRACALLGPPQTPVERILRWTAHWVKRGGRILGRPTHFEVRDGNY
jgi:nucleoside-diphosphate-sugar epimerase